MPYTSTSIPAIALPTHILEDIMSVQQFLSFVFRGIALAMGVAAAVVGILGSGSPNSLITMLGIGLACLGLWALQKGQ